MNSLAAPSNVDVSPNVKAYFDQGFDPTHQAVTIGTCPDGKVAYALLGPLPRDLQVGCVDGKHLWSTITLAEAIAHLDPDKPRKKTTKMMLISQIGGWQFYTKLAPGMQAYGADLMRYKPAMQVAARANTVNPEEEDGVEEIPRPDLDAAVVLQRPDTSSGAEVEKGTVLAYVQAAKDLFDRHGAQFVRDLPLLYMAYRSGDMNDIASALIVILPRYFDVTPAWLRQLSTNQGTLLMVQELLEHPLMVATFQTVASQLSLPQHFDRPLSILPPDHAANRNARNEVEMAQQRRNRNGC